jgi:predicted nuclease of predicted toxin-antitoxin system
VIKLYLDENVPESIAMALRLRGYDVITVKEVGRKGLSDIEQLEYASSENRLIFTFNVADFHKIHSEFIKTGRHHNGIILSKQLPVRRTVKALLKLLSSLNSEKVRNNVVWLSDWVE